MEHKENMNGMIPRRCAKPHSCVYFYVSFHFLVNIFFLSGFVGFGSFPSSVEIFRWTSFFASTRLPTKSIQLSYLCLSLLHYSRTSGQCQTKLLNGKNYPSTMNFTLRSRIKTHALKNRNFELYEKPIDVLINNKVLLENYTH